jgi:hypothetical protein
VVRGTGSPRTETENAISVRKKLWVRTEKQGVTACQPQQLLSYVVQIAAGRERREIRRDAPDAAVFVARSKAEIAYLPVRTYRCWALLASLPLLTVTSTVLYAVGHYTCAVR